MTFKGIDLTPLLTGLLSVITILIGWIGTKMKAAAEATAQANRTQQALVKVGVLATTLLGRAWDRLAPEIQKAVADGEVTAEERAAIEAAVKTLIYYFVTEQDLKALAQALGLPLPGLIAKIASMALDTFTKAHDPSNPTVSSLAFPVAEPAASDAG